MDEQRLLKDLNLEKDVRKIKANRYKYEYDLGSIDFVFLNKISKKDFFETHNEIWCENEAEFFLVNFRNEEIHICDAKTKPNIKEPIKNASIDSFRYGESSPKAQKYMELFKKENIDTGECFREILKFLRKRERKTVDKDLLENLEERRNKIVNLLGERDDKEEIAQKIIDRCLFIRFLEDRAGRDSLKSILSDKKLDGERKIKRLLQLFDFYNDSFDGDIFEKGDIPEGISVEITKELDYIFGEVYTYPTLQRTLFPYSFKSIPIILISNIYEKFLAKEKRKSEGIVFTPENIVDYIIKKMLENNGIADKIKNGKIKVLDPACGSGVFLVKFLEKIIDIKKEGNGGKLSLEEKAGIVKNCLYGIDKNNDALRISALSLYLKIIEDEEPEVINEKLFGKNKNHFVFPGLKRNKNLVNADSLFNDVFDGETFDIIVGNPPWGYDFTEKEKKSIKRKWPKVSKYQSSQCFLFQIEKWMKKETICGMVVNLSNFTNSISNEFREYFIRKYYLRLFINLSRIKSITFGSRSEPACIIIFTKFPHNNHNNIGFYTPYLSQFSKLTNIISDGHKSEVSIEELKKDDNLWHIYALGYDIYVDLIEFIDNNKNTLDQFKDRFEVGIMKYWKGFGLTREEYYKKYKNPLKISDDYFPILDSLNGVLAYFGKEKKEYLKYGPHLDRARDIKLFEGIKLIITRSWPIRAFLDSDTALYDGNFYIFKLRKSYPDEYLYLFESILNSKLARFYLGVKYLLRKEGNYSKVNLQHLKQFPIPDIENKNKEVEEIISINRLLKKLNFYKKSDYIEKIQDKLDRLIFELYDLDYYAIRQIEHYYKLEKEKKKILVTDEDMYDYCKEFVESFKPFIKDEFYINANWNISDFFGAIVRFAISESKIRMGPDKEKLKKFISIIEKHEIEGYDRRKVFKEEKIKFYDNDKLYIYKSNKPNDWTKLMAIKDANEEIGLFFRKLEEM